MPNSRSGETLTPAQKFLTDELDELIGDSETEDLELASARARVARLEGKVTLPQIALLQVDELHRLDKFNPEDSDVQDTLELFRVILDNAQTTGEVMMALLEADRMAVLLEGPRLAEFCKEVITHLRHQRHLVREAGPRAQAVVTQLGITGPWLQVWETIINL